MPLPTPEMTKTGDDIIALVVARLVPFQNRYFRTHGRFWQGVRNPATTPKNGGELTLSKTAKPSDQAEGWGDLANLPTKAPASFIVTAYDGAHGAGYTLTAEVEISGTLYRKRINLGEDPAFGGVVDWFAVPPEPAPIPAGNPEPEPTPEPPILPAPEGWPGDYSAEDWP